MSIFSRAVICVAMLPSAMLSTIVVARLVGLMCLDRPVGGPSGLSLVANESSTTNLEGARIDCTALVMAEGNARRNLALAKAAVEAASAALVAANSAVATALSEYQTALLTCT